MSVDTLIREGRLTDALAEQTQRVKQAPGDADQRYVLFCLLAFAGELDRALIHLDALAHGDQQLGVGTVVYRNLLNSEEERRRVYENRSEPVFPPDAPAWLGERFSAFLCALGGEPEAARERFEALGDSGALLAGKVGEHAFDAVRDADDLLGPVLEVFAGGRYLWMPFSDIRRLTVSEPASLADLLWIPANLEDGRGDVADVHLPVRYAGSQTAAQEPLRLGNATQFESVAETLSRGFGQKLIWTVSEGEVLETPILELRTLDLTSD